FQLNTLITKVLIDQNGNGVEDLSDFSPLTEGGAYYVVSVAKVGGGHLFTDTLGRAAVPSVNHANIDLGTYVATVTANTAPGFGWIQTAGAVQETVHVTTSGASPQYLWLNYKGITVSGVKYEDHNGNGTKDGAGD